MIFIHENFFLQMKNNFVINVKGNHLSSSVDIIYQVLRNIIRIIINKIIFQQSNTKSFSDM
jgi:mRNA-degrading endonuclease HigB of HigAB toxin-antitoxin module